jgi:hypothetical protein
MARGSHELSKVSPWPAMLDPSTPFGRATPKMALQPFQGWPSRRTDGLRPSSTLLDTPRRTPITNGAESRDPFSVLKPVLEQSYEAKLRIKI